MEKVRRDLIHTSQMYVYNIYYIRSAIAHPDVDYNNLQYSSYFTNDSGSTVSGPELLLDAIINIYLPCVTTIQWYPLTLCHEGSRCLVDTMSMHSYSLHHVDNFTLDS